MLRDDPNAIFPTLAIQLADKWPTFDSEFDKLLNWDREINCRSPNVQHKVITIPLQKSDLNPLIVIDGLDQCKTDEDIIIFLSALNETISENPNVKFLITSRTCLLPGAREALGELAGCMKMKLLHEVEVKDDMKLFFKDKLSKTEHSAEARDYWLGENPLNELSKDAGGLFSYAVEMVNCISREDLVQQKNFLLPPREKINLGQFYAPILERVLWEDNPDHDRELLSILGTIVLATKPISPPSIAILLNVHIEDVMICLRIFEPILIHPEGKDGPVEPFHHSLSAFLTTQALCTDERFYISPCTHHGKLFNGCLELIAKEKKSREMLLGAVTNCTLGDPDKCINDALAYAHESWEKHCREFLVLSPTFASLFSSWFKDNCAVAE